MLVLTRKRNERIHILVPDGPTIVVTVAEFPAENKVQIGVSAPRDVRIVREELLTADSREAIE